MHTRRFPALAHLFVLLAALVCSQGWVYGQDPASSRSADERLLLDGQYEKLVSKLKSSPASDLDSRLLLSQAYEGLDEYDNAVRVAKSATKSHPAEARAQLRLAQALRAKMSNASKLKAMMIVGDYKKAFRKARELDPTNLDAREEEIGFLTQAPGIAGGDKKKAATLIADLKRLNLSRGSRLEASLLRGQGKNEEAADILELALEADPDDEALRLQTALAQQRLSRYKQADAHFDVLAESENQERALMALYQRARSRVVGEYELEAAVDQFKTYLEKLEQERRSLPSRASAYWRMGMAYERLAKRDAAKSAYQTALSKDPDHKGAKAALKALR